jgi:adenylylsulfate kinase-like enzyme
MRRVEITEEEIQEFWDGARVKMRGRKITRDQVPALAWETYLAGEGKFTVAHRVYWEMAR